MTLFIENLNIIHNLEPTQTVNMGSTLNLVFEVEAHNDGIYTWFFNDEAIENSNNSILQSPVYRQLMQVTIFVYSYITVAK